jgi:uncharacterized protein (UPF0210 family)
MKVRSITAFAPSGLSVEESAATGGAFLARAREAVTATGIEVQTVRLALPPLAEMVQPAARPRELVELAIRTEGACQSAGVDYVSLGPWRPGDPETHAATLPEILARTSRLFVTLSYAGRDYGVDLRATRLAAATIIAAAPLEQNGFANLRFAALANVDSGVPFLPAAWSSGERWHFAFAMECADLARTAFSSADDLRAGADALTRAIEADGDRLVGVASGLADPEFRFSGIDFSLAPFPRDTDSIGATLESMGLETCGLPGTTAAAAILTTALNEVQLPLTGFSGLFLPVLEDDRLAYRAAEGDLRLEDLMLACTVCGTGLDTVPLPGDATAEDLLPWLLDLGALAVRLDKPLTARLMPMPGLEAGDPLEFEFPFFAPSAVMDLPRTRWTGVTDASGPLPIKPRR